MGSDLPAGWKHATLRELSETAQEPLQPLPSERYREIGVRSFGKGVFVKPETTGAEIGNKRVFHVVCDALVANIVFAWEGAITRTSKAHRGLVASHRFPMWKPISDRADLDYLTHYFAAPDGVAMASAASPGGAGRNRTLNRSVFESTKFPLPPLPEQKKIAAILSSVDDAIQATQAVIDQTRQVKKGLLQELLTRGIGPDGQPHSRLKKTEIGEIPESWHLKTFSSVISKPLRNGYSPVCPEVPNGQWVLGLGALTADGLDAEQVKPAPPEDSKVRDFILRHGDLLISRSNTADRVGNGGCLPW